MKFDRKKFFNAYKSSFGKLDEYQVQGLNRLLRLYEIYWGWWDNIEQIGNSLSQIKHETANSFSPVVECYYLGDKNSLSAEDYFHGNNTRVRNAQKRLKYFPYFGIGDIQLTWLHNYEKHEKLLRVYFPEIVQNFEKRTGQKLDLVKNPRQMLDGEISFAVMTIGMHCGTFTGKKLDSYNSPNGFDHFNARSIVNGDKYYPVKNSNLNVGELIAKNAEKFVEILRISLLEDFSDLDPELEFDIPQENSANGAGAVTLPQPINSDPDRDKVSEVNPVADPLPTPSPTSAPEPNRSEPIGDKPESEPKTWLNVEDWKPWVFSKLKWVWSAFSGANFAQFSGNTFAAMKDSENWWVYLAAAGAILLISLFICAVISLILLAIWYFNRKEIKEYFHLSYVSKIDPNLKNLGLKFEKIQ